MLLHGFTQTGASWEPVAGRLDGDVACPDLDCARGLWHAAAVAARAGPAAYVGYSMGGRVALHLALAHPEVVERLVLVSATAGIDDPAERAARHAEDEARARRIEDEGVDAFLDAWLAQPMFATLEEPGPRCRDAAVLTAALRTCGTGSQEPLWDRLGEIAAPTLVVAGERDAKFVALGERLAAGIPGARLVVVEGAGHALHLERPEVLADLLLSH